MNDIAIGTVDSTPEYNRILDRLQEQVALQGEYIQGLECILDRLGRSLTPSEDSSAEIPAGLTGSYHNTVANFGRQNDALSSIVNVFRELF